MKDFLKETVIDGGYCIGCGACTAVDSSNYSIEMNAFGQYVAQIDDEIESGISGNRADKVCPFSEKSKDEDTIGAEVFGEEAQFNPFIGYYLASYAGYVCEGGFRKLGSSGGMGKWILYELLKEGLVDAVIQIGLNLKTSDDIIYNYTVMKEPGEILTGSKSVYYPIEMSEALLYIKENPGRYAITGIPCFIKGLRLLESHESVFDERIHYHIGLICGHLKSRHYADMIAWQLGVKPGKLNYIDFRKKLPGTRANEKGVEVESIVESENTKGPEIVQNLFGTNYNHGFFQYNACNFCDDVVGETADISVGDAWLQEYLEDGAGTNVVVVRNPVIHRLIENAIDDGRLEFKKIDPETVVQSQAGGFRQRREGLAYRLHLTDETGAWRPPKRVKADATLINKKRKKIYELRMEMTEQSHTAFQKALRVEDLNEFKASMVPLLRQYQELYKPGIVHRIKRGITRRKTRLIKMAKRIMKIKDLS